ncbi:MAG: hypothetical protein ACPGJS_09250 [Flammeovirgaceae bacterium]
MDWFVLNDASGALNPRFLELDKEGNTYLVGEYSGEVMFRSAEPSADTFHTLAPSKKKVFLSKYDVNGNLLFGATIKALGSSNHLIGIRGFKVLADGRLLVGVYSDYDIIIRDANGEKHQFKLYKKMLLLYFSNDGKFLKHTKFPYKHAHHFQEDQYGRIYCVARGRSRGIFYQDKGTEAFQQLNFTPLRNYNYNSTLFQGYQVLGDDLWILIVENKTERYSKKHLIQLYKLNARKTPTTIAPIFTKKIEGYSDYACNLVVNQGTVEVVLGVNKSKNATFKVNSSKLFDFAHNGLVIFSADGQVKLKEDMSFLPARSLRVTPSQIGGYYVLGRPYKTFKLKGQQDSIMVKAHSPYVYDQLLMKVDDNFSLEWYTKAGGTSDQYFVLGVQEHQGSVIYASAIRDYGEFLGAYKEVNWLAGCYLMKIKPPE